MRIHYNVAHYLTIVLRNFLLAASQMTARHIELVFISQLAVVIFEEIFILIAFVCYACFEVIHFTISQFILQAK
jgi:hypothetical protein